MSDQTTPQTIADEDMDRAQGGVQIDNNHMTTGGMVSVQIDNNHMTTGDQTAVTIDHNHMGTSDEVAVTIDHNHRTDLY